MGLPIKLMNPQAVLRSKLTFFFVLCAFLGKAQVQQQDSVKLPVDTFLMLVERHHPLAVKARLIKEQARAQKLKASGMFDPKLYSDVSQKRFKKTDYYSLQNSGLEIPAWFGLKAKAGYELNDGVFLNDQNTVPGSGLWYGDLSWTLGKGLFIDERRAAIKQARLLEEAAEFEIDLALNQLFLEALNSYWDWYAAYMELRVYKDALDQAKFRFDAVKRAALVGDEPFIDTLESAIQVQDREVKLQSARANYIFQSNILNSYLWMNGQVPLVLNGAVRPQYDFRPMLSVLPDDWFENHPALNAKALKIDRLNIERRLNQELLKPELTVNYKFLNAPTQNDFFAEYSPDNYSWGLKASFPLFVRKGRGEVLKTKVKIQENELELELKRLQIQNKVVAYQAELSLMSQQLQSVNQMVANYRRLLEAENIKFRNGESSLFLVNSRELKYIDSRLKQIKTEAKLQLVEAKLKAEAGVLFD